MDYISKLTDFLLSPLAASLLATHPNETAVIHPDWQNWWGWAAADRKPLQALLDHYVVRLASTPLDHLPTVLVPRWIRQSSLGAKELDRRRENPAISSRTRSPCGSFIHRRR